MPTTEELSRAADRRARMLGWIVDLVNARGYPPSQSELMREFEVSSGQVRKDLKALEEVGAIKQTKGVGRGLQVLRQSVDDPAPDA